MKGIKILAIVLPLLLIAMVALPMNVKAVANDGERFIGIISDTITNNGNSLQTVIETYFDGTTNGGEAMLYSVNSYLSPNTGGGWKVRGDNDWGCGNWGPSWYSQFTSPRSNGINFPSTYYYNYVPDTKVQSQPMGTITLGLSASMGYESPTGGSVGFSPSISWSWTTYYHEIGPITMNGAEFKSSGKTFGDWSAAHTFGAGCAMKFNGNSQTETYQSISYSSQGVFWKGGWLGSTYIYPTENFVVSYPVKK